MYYQQETMVKFGGIVSGYVINRIVSAVYSFKILLLFLK